jgi:hypothetical protein
MFQRVAPPMLPRLDMFKLQRHKRDVILMNVAVLALMMRPTPHGLPRCLCHLLRPAGLRVFRATA